MKSEIVRLCRINYWIIRESPISSKLGKLFKSNIFASHINICELIHTLIYSWFFVILCSVTMFVFSYNVTELILLLNKNPSLFNIFITNFNFLKSFVYIVGLFAFALVSVFLLIKLFKILVRLIDWFSGLYSAMLNSFGIKQPTNLFNLYAKSIKNKFCTTFLVEFKDMDCKKI